MTQESDTFELEDSKRAKLFSDALSSLEEWKDLIIGRFVDLYGKTDSRSNFSLKDNFSEDRGQFNSYQKMAVRGILTQKGIESIKDSNLDHLNPQVRDLVKRKSSEAKLTNDLAHFSLNNSCEFINFCKDTLKGEIDRSNYTADFLGQLDTFYARSSNFTNTFLSFYMSHIDKINYVSKTKEISTNFVGWTELVTVRQSGLFDVYKGVVVQRKKGYYTAFSVDLQESIDKVLDAMFVKGDENNPFRVRMDGLYYFRDLDNNFSTYANYEDKLRSQFVENILHHTDSLFIGYEGSKAYFRKRGLADEVVKNSLVFNVYGVDFHQQIEPEVIDIDLGGVAND